MAEVGVNSAMRYEERSGELEPECTIGKANEILVAILQDRHTVKVRTATTSSLRLCKSKMSDQKEA
jgi:hypothetical protein